MTLLLLVRDDDRRRLNLQVSGLQVRAPDQRALLQIDSLRVAAGERVCITGPSGAGKSTCLFALAGLAEHADGSVRWDDLELLSASRSRRAAFRHRHIGLVFQDHLLFEELSALDNAALADAWAAEAVPSAGGTEHGIPRQGSRRDNAAILLEQLGIDPDDTRSVLSHSGGERQRIAVARALASCPSIILADEPTASLDRATADVLIGDLVSLAGVYGQTLIVVSHDPHLRDACDRTISLADGSVHHDTIRMAHEPSDSASSFE